MNSELVKKLEIILHHWIEHNEDHAVEYETWANKAKEEGLADIANIIREAGKGIQKTNEKLFQALEALKKSTKGNE